MLKNLCQYNDYIAMNLWIYKFALKTENSKIAIYF